MTPDDELSDGLLQEAKRRVAASSVEPQTHFDLAIAYSEMGLVEDAISEFEALLRLQPGHEEARARLEFERSRLEPNQDQPE